MRRHLRLTKRRLATIAVALFCLLVPLLVPLPLKITAQDEADAVGFAVDSLLAERRVWTERGLGVLYDAAFVKKKARLYFENRAGLDDAIFTRRGLKPIPKDGGVALDGGSPSISFAHETIKGEPAAHLQFVYSFGSVGAQGYEIRVYKCLLGRYFVFVHQWVS